MKTRPDGTPITLDWLRSVSTPEPNSGCWLWDLYVTKKGYPRVHTIRGRLGLAHRESYKLAKGAIPAGYHIDHLCRVRCCVNPDHLEAVTGEENHRRGRHVALYVPPTHCKKGHAFGPDNPPLIRSSSKAWCCRICRAAIVKKWNDIGNGARKKNWTPEQRSARSRINSARRWGHKVDPADLALTGMEL